MLNVLFEYWDAGKSLIIEFGKKIIMKKANTVT
jgi:hypothetical protein